MADNQREVAWWDRRVMHRRMWWLPLLVVMGIGVCGWCSRNMR